VFARHEASKTRANQVRIQPATPYQDDRFAELVRQVATDPTSPFNIERYLWVLDGPPLRWCARCGELFDPWFAYAGGPARGLPRRYCSPLCAGRAAEGRRRLRLAAMVGEWGRAA
jgi:hypothetical protein